MASLMSTRLAESDDEFGRNLQACTDQFQSGSEFLSEALRLVVENVRFVRANWDEEFERLLRESGFQGSLFILQEWRLRLEAIKTQLSPVLSDLIQTTERGTSKGWGEIRREAEHHDPVLGSATRPICRAVIDFTDFEERSARTAIIFSNYEIMRELRS